MSTGFEGMAREEKKGRPKGGNEKEENTQKVHRRNQHKLLEHQPKAKMKSTPQGSRRYGTTPGGGGRIEGSDGDDGRERE